MKKVINVELEPSKNNNDPSPVVLKKYLSGSSSRYDLSNSKSENILLGAKNVVYLGSCRHDGDMFAVYTSDGYISVYSGELNDGVY